MGTTNFEYIDISIYQYSKNYKLKYSFIDYASMHIKWHFHKYECKKLTIQEMLAPMNYNIILHRSRCSFEKKNMYKYISFFMFKIYCKWNICFLCCFLD